MVLLCDIELPSLLVSSATTHSHFHMALPFCLLHPGCKVLCIYNTNSPVILPHLVLILVNNSFKSASSISSSSLRSILAVVVLVLSRALTSAPYSRSKFAVAILCGVRYVDWQTAISGVSPMIHPSVVALTSKPYSMRSLTVSTRPWAAAQFKASRLASRSMSLAREQSSCITSKLSPPAACVMAESLLGSQMIEAPRSTRNLTIV